MGRNHVKSTEARLPHLYRLNLLLDEVGGPNIGPFFCGGLATLNSQTGELTYSGQYRAFSHFQGI